MNESIGLEEQFSKHIGKNLAEGITLTGEFELKHIRDGKIIDMRVVKNLVVDAGKAAVAGLINGVVTNFFDFIAIGIGTVAAAAGDTALGSEITTGGGARAASTNTRVTTTVTNDTAQCQVTFTFTASFAVTEAGLMDTASAGGMLARQVFAAVNVVNGDSLQITWKIKAA